ncbi:uncharacterized protein KY384_003413 [Bacidia gigantensis]|uniref:uncharacterized protein n=1 Tax=Bacidia gigantensis TaxID=2732470 RepID=UPI001D0398EE|nr:uncharacterized protein KY384_003413 [Bacidia gigantensis]KAG8531777.1 hypothetical protein KY384_003413 [Bacidia gigantensis]
MIAPLLDYFRHILIDTPSSGIIAVLLCIFTTCLYLGKSWRKNARLEHTLNIKDPGNGSTREENGSGDIKLKPTANGHRFTPSISTHAVVPLNKDGKPVACRKIGLQSPSNLADEYDSVYDGPAQKEKNSTWRVKSAWAYPVKSCKGVELDTFKVTGLGVEYDRQFSFAQYQKRPKTHDEGWKFVTQREIPALTNIETEIWAPDPSSSDYTPDHPNVQSEGVISICWPEEMSNRTVYVPFKPSASQIKEQNYATVDMNIWNDTPPALILCSTSSLSHLPNGPTPWLSSFVHYLSTTSRLLNPRQISSSGTLTGPSYDLNKPFALLRSAPAYPRSVFRNAPRKETLGYQPTIGFQDAYPVQLLGLASVRDVGRKLAPGTPPLSAKNFRSNIIVVGGNAYEEDRWKYIRFHEATEQGNEEGRENGAEFHVACRTSRCLMPNVDQDTGKKDAVEPNSTLRSFRKIDAGCKNDACLGMHMVPAAQEGRWISVGDEVDVVEVTDEHLYVGSKQG